MQSNMQKRCRSHSSHRTPGSYAGCGGVGRRSESFGRTSRNQLPNTGRWSTRTGVHSRPGSAKDWVQQCQQKREMEETRKQQWDQTDSYFRANQFHANFFNAHPSSPRCCSAQSHPQENEADNKNHCNTKEINFADEEIENPETIDVNGNSDQKFSKYNSTSILKNNNKSLLSPEEFLTPEITALKCRLEELQTKNAKERQKLNEQLSHRAWQGSSTEARKLESERLKEFTSSAWLGQKQWRLEQQRMQLEEGRRIEEESRQIRKLEEEKLAQIAEERQQKKEQYLRDLQDQLDSMRVLEQRRRQLEAAEAWLVQERHRLIALQQQRKEVCNARKCRQLAVSWTKQHLIKLKQRAAQVLQEVQEDENILQQMRSVTPRDQQPPTPTKNKEQYVLSVLTEHRRLEEARQKEYELLFSEEAARLYNTREQQWKQEERARDTLLQEVLTARQRQLEEKEAQRLRDLQETIARHQHCNAHVKQVEEEMALLDHSPPPVTTLAAPADDDPVAAALDRVTEQRRREEIARLEAEMARLWGPLYTQPHYGRKKVQW